MVVIGIVAEVLISVFHPPYDSVWERWGSTIANALVVLGVAGEILFSRMGFRRDHEIKRRSDQKIAEATGRAIQAELELARFKGPRVLTLDQQASIVETVRPFSGTIFDVG